MEGEPPADGGRAKEPEEEPQSPAPSPEVPPAGYGPGGYAPPPDAPPPVYAPPSSPPGYGPPQPSYGPPPAYPPPPPYQPPGPETAWQPPQGTGLADFGARAGAAVVDFLIRFSAFAVIAGFVVLLWLGVGEAAGITALVIGIVAALAVSLLYAPLFMAREGERNGQTPGHQVTSTRIVRDDGRSMDVGWGMLREVAVKAILFEGLGGFFFSIPTLVNYLWPLWDDQNRALHDMICKTHVLKA